MSGQQERVDQVQAVIAGLDAAARDRMLATLVWHGMNDCGDYAPDAGQVLWWALSGALGAPDVPYPLAEANRTATWAAVAARRRAVAQPFG